MDRLRFRRFVDRYIDDADFREEFAKDRVKAVKSMGYKITPKVEKALEALELDSLHDLAVSLEGHDACC